MTQPFDGPFRLSCRRGTRRRWTAQLLYEKVLGLGIPFDIIVATPNNLKKHENNIGLIYRTILQEDKEIYAA